MCPRVLEDTSREGARWGHSIFNTLLAGRLVRWGPGWWSTQGGDEEKGPSPGIDLARVWPPPQTQPQMPYQFDRRAHSMGAPMQVSKPVEAFDRHRQAIQKPAHEQAVFMMMTDL